MAKSKSIRSSSSNAEKISTNPLVQQWRGIRSEVAKVTWPTREEAQKLTIAVTIAMVAMALFLYAMDAIFQVVIGGVLDFYIVLGDSPSHAVSQYIQVDNIPFKFDYTSIKCT